MAEKKETIHIEYSNTENFSSHLVDGVILSRSENQEMISMIFQRSSRRLPFRTDLHIEGDKVLSQDDAYDSAYMDEIKKNKIKIDDISYKKIITELLIDKNDFYLFLKEIVSLANTMLEEEEESE